MSSSDLKRTLMDIRKMRRAVRMRAETDPEVVSQTLETILKEAIALSTSEDGTMSRAAIKEIRQVRKGLLAQQIDAGQNTSRYIGSFSAVLDTINSTADEVAKEAESERANYRSSLSDSLPSSDTVISAIMTANPLMGYSLKMGRDLMSSAKKSSEQRRNRDKEEAQLRRRRLEEQQLVLEEQLVTEDLKRDNLEETTPEQDVYQRILEDIKDEIHQLNVIWGNDSQTLEEIHNESTDASTRLEEIHNEDVKQNTLERQRDDLSGLQGSESDFESGNSSLLGGAAGAAGQVNDESGGLGDLLSGGLGRFIQPILGIFGVIKTAGSLFLKLGKGSLILAAVKGVYDFIDGIFRADEILGTDNIDWMDRVKVGISSVLSGLLEPINWITKTFFGTDMMGGKDKDGMTKQYFDFFDNFTDNIIGMAKWIGTSILDSFTEWTSKSADFISNLASDAFQPLLDLMETVKNFIREKISEFTPDFITKWFSDEEQETIIKEKPGVGSNSNRGLRSASKSAINIEEEMSSSKSVTSGAIQRSENDAEEYSRVVGGRGSSQSGSTVIAPSNSTTNVHSSQYIGNGASDNKEPTHRRFNGINNLLGAGNL